MLSPAPGTPAYNLFNGIVDMATGGGFNIPRVGDGQVIYTFTGLNPAMAYSFHASGSRGRESDPTTDERWVKVSVGGYAYLVDSSTPGCTTLATYPAAAGSLGPGESALNIGRNVTAGDVVGWDNIIAPANGTITVTLRIYTGPINKVDGAGQPLFANGAFGYSLQGFQLVETGPAAVTITGDPVPNTTLKQLDPLSLSVIARGTSLQFQWYKGPTLIPDATSATYALASAAPGDSGDYTVVVSNPINSQTSKVAHVTVNADTTPPQVLSVSVNPVDPYGSVNVVFDEILEATSATDVGNYALNGPGPSAVALASVALGNDQKSVTIVVDSAGGGLVANTSYSLTMHSLKDRVPNTISPISVPFSAWPLSRGFIRYDYFSGLDSGNNTLAQTLLVDPRYPQHPTTTYYLSAFDSRTIFPDDSHEGYGAHITGFFIAPTNGDYQFFLKSDDSSQLYLNPTGPTAAGKVLLTEETGCCGVFSGHPSSPQSLVAGQAYYVEANFKEGTGGDFIQVAMKDATDPTNPDNLLPMTGVFMGTAANPSGAPVVTIVQNPHGQTNLENSQLTFTVVATNSTGASQFYVWRKNGVEIPLANGSSYTTPPTQESDDGAIFDVVVYVLGGSATSAPARIGVLTDVTPPTIVHVSLSSGLDQIIVTFSELVDPTTATDYLNYGLTGPGQPFTFGTPTLLGDGKTVSIPIVGGLAEHTTYTLTVAQVTDLKGNAIADGSTADFTSLPLSTGFLKFEYYPGIAGVAVANLTSHSSFINNTPGAIYYLSAFDTRLVFPDNAHDNFGGRITGVFIPPTSGNWIFYLKSDDASQLFLNPAGPGAAGKVLLTEETACCNPFSAHISPPQALTAGSAYYIEALYKEGIGGDFCQVAAKLDTDPAAPNTLQPIPGSMLGSYLDTTGASLTINQQPANQSVGRSNPSQTVGLETFTSGAGGNGGYSVVNGIEGGNPPAASEQWLYNPVRGTWAANGGEGIKNTALNSPPLTVTTAGPLTLIFNHRYNFEYDGTRWDGGLLRVSINRSAYATVPSTAITGENYQTDIVIGGNCPPVAGQFAFNNASPNFATGAFVESRANLGTLNAGDSVSVQFIGAWDEGTVQQPPPGWEITSVEFSPTVENRNADGTVTFSVQATATLGTQPNVPIAYQWQRKQGGVFVDVAGANAASFTLLPTVTDDGAVFRCKLISPGASAQTQEATLTVAPGLRIRQQVGGQLVISWPDAGAYVLQRTSALLTPATTFWADVPGGDTVGGLRIVTLSPASAQAFFRLRH
jgi:hypothetical protein